MKRRRKETTKNCWTLLYFVYNKTKRKCTEIWSLNFIHVDQTFFKSTYTGIVLTVAQLQIWLQHGEICFLWSFTIFFLFIHFKHPHSRWSFELKSVVMTESASIFPLPWSGKPCTVVLNRKCPIMYISILCKATNSNALRAYRW